MQVTIPCRVAVHVSPEISQLQVKLCVTHVGKQIARVPQVKTATKLVLTVVHWTGWLHQIEHAVCSVQLASSLWMTGRIVCSVLLGMQAHSSLGSNVGHATRLTRQRIMRRQLVEFVRLVARLTILDQNATNVNLNTIQHARAHAVNSAPLELSTTKVLIAISHIAVHLQWSAPRT